MQHEIFKYLMDIKISLDRIDELLLSIKDFSEFEKDLRTRLAIERLLEIIGEALNKAVKLEPNLPISNIPKIISLRNRIIHAYDDVDETIIWAVLRDNLPHLKSEVEAILHE